MKKMMVISAAALLAATTLFCGPTLARGPHHEGYHRGGPHHRHAGGSGIGLLVRYQRENLAVQVLSEMSGQPADSVRHSLQTQRLPALLETYQIDRQAFRKAMQAKVRGLLKSAVSQGSLTEKQRLDILNRMERRTQRWETMRSVIEKGLRDGTITQEQAASLCPKHF